jgi:hypothetical protein
MMSIVSMDVGRIFRVCVRQQQPKNKGLVTDAKIIGFAKRQNISLSIVRQGDEILIYEARSPRCHLVLIDDLDAAAGPTGFTLDALSSIRFAEYVAVSLVPIDAAFIERIANYHPDPGSAKIAVFIQTTAEREDAWCAVDTMFRRSRSSRLWTGIPSAALTPAASRFAQKQAVDDIRYEAERRARYRRQ